MSGPPTAPTAFRWPMDPRIRRRQIDVRRAEGRRRLRVVTAAVVVVVGALAAWGITRSPLLDVDRVTVVGAARSGTAAVRTAAAVPAGRALLDVDEGAVARRVEALPWVLRAEVRRAWPATVVISVTERSAAAVTSDDTGGWAVLDGTGRVLSVVPSAPPDLAVIDGVTPAGAPGTRVAPPAAAALRVTSAVPPGLRSRVGSVRLSADGITLALRPVGTVVLGTPDGIDAKLRAALTVLGAVDGRTVATLDVRDPSTPVLTRG